MIDGRRVLLITGIPVFPKIRLGRERIGYRSGLQGHQRDKRARNRSQFHDRSAGSIRT